MASPGHGRCAVPSAEQDGERPFAWASGFIWAQAVRSSAEPPVATRCRGCSADSGGLGRCGSLAGCNGDPPVGGSVRLLRGVRKAVSRPCGGSWPVHHAAADDPSPGLGWCVVCSACALVGARVSAALGGCAVHRQRGPAGSGGRRAPSPRGVRCPVRRSRRENAAQHRAPRWGAAHPRSRRAGGFGAAVQLRHAVNHGKDQLRPI